MDSQKQSIFQKLWSEIKILKLHLEKYYAVKTELTESL